MSDQQTIAVYNSQVNAYADFSENEETGPSLQSFIDRVEAGGYVLDLGCGPGHDASIMRRSGLSVDAVDASAEMIRLANERFGLNARVGTFTEISAVDRYDGVWANFSLLHAEATEFPGILRALSKALKPGGVIHLGMKTGDGSGRDKLGRFYTYYSEQQLGDHLESAGFAVEDTQASEGVGLAGDVEPWITIRAVASDSGSAAGVSKDK